MSDDQDRLAAADWEQDEERFVTRAEVHAKLREMHERLEALRNEALRAGGIMLTNPEGMMFSAQDKATINYYYDTRPFTNDELANWCETQAERDLSHVAGWLREIAKRLRATPPPVTDAIPHTKSHGAGGRGE